jgi:hypothetical protein
LKKYDKETSDDFKNFRMNVFGLQGLEGCFSVGKYGWQVQAMVSN